MSTVIVLTPLIIANWPVITAAVTAAVSTMGFTAVRAAADAGVETLVKNKAEIEVDNSEVLAASAGTGQEIVVEREGIRATFRRDVRGALKVCVEGEGYTKAELREVGQELIDRVTQQYVYHRVISELKDRNMTVVGEEVKDDRTVKIRIRNS
jgi:hypothetical protein